MTFDTFWRGVWVCFEGYVGECLGVFWRHFCNFFGGFLDGKQTCTNTRKNSVMILSNLIILLIVLISLCGQDFLSSFFGIRQDGPGAGGAQDFRKEKHRIFYRISYNFPCTSQDFRGKIILFSMHILGISKNIVGFSWKISGFPTNI